MALISAAQDYQRAAEHLCDLIHNEAQRIQAGQTTIQQAFDHILASARVQFWLTNPKESVAIIAVEKAHFQRNYRENERKAASLSRHRIASGIDEDNDRLAEERAHLASVQHRPPARGPKAQVIAISDEAMTRAMDREVEEARERVRKNPTLAMRIERASSAGQAIEAKRQADQQPPPTQPPLANPDFPPNGTEPEKWNAGHDNSVLGGDK